ncbi:MAG: AgmX/PglI C-terminal domain-containing protein [Bdellovibrionales bacterium]
MKQLIFASALIVGVGLILFQKQFSNYLSHSGNRDGRAPLAQVESFSGSLLLKLPKTLQTQEVNPGDQIHDQETLEVTSDSQATIKFPSGLTVSLLSDTVVYLEMADNIFVTFKKGDYKILQSGQSGEKVYFIREGVVFDPLGRNISKPITIQTEEVVESKTTQISPLSTEPVKSNTTLNTPGPLTDEQITRTLANLRAHFSNCYAQLLKENPEAKGQFYFSTTIQGNGQTTQTRVIQTSLNNETLKNCLLQVIQRAQFDSFKGDPLVINFPIYLE